MANVIHAFTAICAIALSRISFIEMEYFPIFLPRLGTLPQTTDNNLGKATRHWFLFILGISNIILAICESLFVIIYSFPLSIGLPLQIYFGANNLYLYLRWLPSTFYLCLYVMISVFLFELSFSSSSSEFNLSYIYHWQLFSALFFILFFLIINISELQFMIYWILSTEYFSLFLFIIFCGKNILSKLPKTATSSSSYSSSSSSSRLNGSNILNSSVSTQIQNRVYPFLIVVGTSLAINCLYCLIVAIEFSETDMLAVSSNNTSSPTHATHHFWLTIIDCSVMFITQIALSFEILYILTKREEYSGGNTSSALSSGTGSSGLSRSLKSWFSKCIRLIWSRNNNSSNHPLSANTTANSSSYRPVPNDFPHQPSSSLGSSSATSATTSQSSHTLKNSHNRSNSNSSASLHKSIVTNVNKLQYNTATNDVLVNNNNNNNNNHSSTQATATAALGSISTAADKNNFSRNNNKELLL